MSTVSSVVVRKILSDSGTEFKNTLFKDVAKKLGVGIQSLHASLQAPVQTVK